MDTRESLSVVLFDDGLCSWLLYCLDAAMVCVVLGQRDRLLAVPVGFRMPDGNNSACQ